MRTNLEPLIDTLFEEDELFAQDFEEDGLNRILFIRKMGIYVEVWVSPLKPPTPLPLAFSDILNPLRKSMSRDTIGDFGTGTPIPSGVSRCIILVTARCD